MNAPGNGTRGTAPVATTSASNEILRPPHGHRDPAVGFDVGKRVKDELAPALLRDYLREVVDARLRSVEGLGDGHGAVHELAGRRDHGDVHEMAGERAHRQQRL